MNVRNRTFRIVPEGTFGIVPCWNGSVHELVEDY